MVPFVSELVRINEIILFPKCISPKVNILEGLVTELANYDVAVTGTSPSNILLVIEKVGLRDH